jgi:predicted ATPase
VVIVHRPVTIAIAGAHSTGKSTFLAKLAQELRHGNLRVATVADLGEQAQRAGFPILAQHNWASTLWIITQGISNELAAWISADIVLIDRPVPDALGYYRAALDYRGEQPDPATTRYLDTITREHAVHSYDLILRTQLDPAIPLGTNKPRDDNARFRQLADQHVAQVMMDLHLDTETFKRAEHDTTLVRTLAFATARHAAKDRSNQQ